MNKRKIAKRYLELIYDYDANNSVFDCYNEFKEKQRKRWNWLEDDAKNLHIILEDTKFITYYVNEITDCEEWDDICEEVEEMENIFQQLEKQEELKKKLKIGTKVKFTDKDGIEHIGAIKEFQTIITSCGNFEFAHIRIYKKHNLWAVQISQIEEILEEE